MADMLLVRHVILQAGYAFQPDWNMNVLNLYRIYRLSIVNQAIGAKHRYLLVNQ